MSACSFIGAGDFWRGGRRTRKHPRCGIYLGCSAWLSGLPRNRPPKRFQVPPLFTGMFERVLAYTVFFLGVSEAYTILGAWIVVKLASNWQRLSMENVSEECGQTIITHSLIALMAGTLSVAIGATAGAVARSHPEYWNWIVAHWC